MDWCKLYASLQHDQDLRRAGERATLLFVFGLCHCAEEETDGYIADDALPYFKLAGVEARAAALVRVGCWQRVSDGYLIPKWREKQRELYAIMEKRRKDRERLAGKRKMSRDSREKVAVESREEKNPPDPPASGGDRRCAAHKRKRRGCPECELPPLVPVPDWCGGCSPSRRVEDPNTGADLGACPDCHPSSVRAG